MPLDALWPLLLPRLLFAVATAAAVQPPREQAAAPVTYCNPLDLDYKYNFEQQAKGISYRSGADVYTQLRVLHSLDGKNWSVAADLTNERRDRPNAYIQLVEPARARYLAARCR